MKVANLENFACLFQLNLFLPRQHGIYLPSLSRNTLLFGFHIKFLRKKVRSLCENNLNLFNLQEAYVILCSLMRASESSKEITMFPGALDQIRDGRYTKCM